LTSNSLFCIFNRTKASSYHPDEDERTASDQTRGVRLSESEGQHQPGARCGWQNESPNGSGADNALNTGEIPGKADKKWRNLLHFDASGVEGESRGE
jgi:hypothetical protein